MQRTRLSLNLSGLLFFGVRVAVTDTKLLARKLYLFHVGYDDEDMLLPQSQQIPGLYKRPFSQDFRSHGTE